jgi:outer membrane protein assembly factor BamD
MTRRLDLRRLFVAALVAGLAGVACGKKPQMPNPQGMEPDRYLFEAGNVLLQRKNWITSREYFKRLVDTFPGSPYRQDAKIGIGDTYIGEERVDSLILAVNEYREFLQFFPLSPRADYVRYRICQASSKQMLSSQRDQTATHETLTECDRFLNSYPASPYRAEVTKIRREARDRLSKWELEVGLLYFRRRNYEGAAARFRTLLNDDPEYSGRDAAYFHLGEMYYRTERPAEALPYFDRVVTEFPRGEYAGDAAKRIRAIKR